MNSDEKKLRVAIFPYDSKYEPVCKYADMIEKIKIEKILSFQGWGLVGRKIICAGKELHIEDYMRKIETSSYDVLWLVESEHKVDNEHLLQICERFVGEGKDILLSRTLENSVRYELEKICEKSGRHFFYSFAQNSEIVDDMEILYDINVPIVAVYGIGEETNKLEIQLGLWSRLKKDGYNVCWISSGCEAAVFGGEIFPEFMYGLHSEKQKIIYYNHFLKWIEQNHKPDIFLLGVPGGIMPVTKKQVGHFGVSSFEVFNAVIPDFTVFSLYFGDVDETYLQEIKKLSCYKFNTEIDAFYLSRVEQDIFSLDKITPIEYIYHDSVEVSKKAIGFTNIRNSLFCEETQSSLYDYMITKLNEYEEMEVL